eukprot:gene4348-14466_t
MRLAVHLALLLGLLQAAWLDQARAAVPNATDATFKSFRKELELVHVNHQSLSSLVSPMLNYKFSLPEIQLRKGMGYLGSNYRLRRVLMDSITGTKQDLITGRKQVKIGVVGGSIS